MFVSIDQNEMPGPALPPEMIRLLSTGQAVFETMLYKENILWFRERHEQRLLKTLAHFKAEFNEIDLKQSITGILRQSRIKTARVKLCVIFPFNQKAKKLTSDNILLHIEECSGKAEKQGIKLLTKEWLCCNEEFLTKYKTINYGRRFYDLGLAQHEGFDDVLYFDKQGNLLETAIANVFAVRDKEIFTPPEKAGIFAGIIRSVLLEKLDVRERQINKNDLGGYDYLFITNSIKEIVFVKQVSGSCFYKRNKHFEFLLDKWEKIKVGRT